MYIEMKTSVARKESHRKENVEGSAHRTLRLLQRNRNILWLLKRHPPTVFLVKERVDRTYSSGEITRSAGCMWPATVFEHIWTH